MSLGCALVLALVLLAIVAPASAGFALNALCKASSALMSRSFDIGGIYFRLFPAGRCTPVRSSDIDYMAYPYKSSLNAPHRRIQPEDDAETLRSYFDPSLPTAVYTHGFFEGNRGASSRAFKAAFLYRKDYNFLAVDWQRLSTGPWYLSAARNTQSVGEDLARMLDRLLEVGAIRLDTLHLIGFSLGAHVSGIAAHHLKAGRVPRITGLDPAFPLFGDKPLSQRLDKSDANFVDVIHTGGGLFGYSDSIGHVDFFPNGGRFVQPGCLLVISVGACSHWRAWRFFEESLRGGEFVGTACSSWPDFSTGRCKNNPTNIMGLNTNLTARGNYYLRTNWAAPFSVY